MKLKAPEGVGDPCVAGAVLTAHDGFYEVEPDVGVLLIECFGFVPVADQTSTIVTRGRNRRHNRGRITVQKAERSIG